MKLRLSRRLRRFRKAEDGNVTIEFVIMVPFMLMIFLSTFELGMLMTRHVMLDRAIDLTVRDVRLGRIADMSHDSLTEEICENFPIMRDCANDLRLEMRPLNPRNFQNIATGGDCVDRDDPSVAVREYTPGQPNQLMILRACALFNPYFPTTGLGASIPRRSGDAYALISTASYVIEPAGGGTN